MVSAACSEGAALSGWAWVLLGLYVGYCAGWCGCVVPRRYQP